MKPVAMSLEDFVNLLNSTHGFEEQKDVSGIGYGQLEFDENGWSQSILMEEVGDDFFWPDDTVRFNTHHPEGLNFLDAQAANLFYGSLAFQLKQRQEEIFEPEKQGELLPIPALNEDSENHYYAIDPTFAVLYLGRFDDAEDNGNRLRAVAQNMEFTPVLIANEAGVLLLMNEIIEEVDKVRRS